ncbi:MAG: hypothetical protein JWQ42_640 [Edaphobacter sp.]|nr:hypothetical protein [Edaphobacter sp.]
MDQWELKRGHWRRMRWLWLASSILGVLSTPSAMVNALDDYKTNHSFGWIVLLAFAMRFGQIWLFAWLWWKCRPFKADTGSAL